MNYSSPDGGISNRVSISGTKRPRERSDSTDEGTEATATTACPIFLKYDEIFENLAEDLEAIIYKSRLVVCIMDEFRHGEPNGQTSRFLLKRESDSREMTFSEAADKIRHTMKNKSDRQ
jgi:hypothetical protein